MQPTRQHILDYLRVQREATVKDIARLLGLTPSGVRQHMTVLEQQGLVQSHEQRGRVGRPALRYVLTPSGDATYPKAYHHLANALIDEVRTTFGSQELHRVIRGVAVRLAAEHPHLRNEPDPEARIEGVAEVFRGLGVVADWERSGNAFLLHERTCPYPEVARRNSVTCAMDVAYVRELSGMDARLTQCIVRGDPCCTYRLVPPVTVGSPVTA